MTTPELPLPEPGSLEAKIVSDAIRGRLNDREAEVLGVHAGSYDFLTALNKLNDRESQIFDAISPWTQTENTDKQDGTTS